MTNEKGEPKKTVFYLWLLFGHVCLILTFVILTHQRLAPSFQRKPLTYWLDYLPATFRSPGTSFIRLGRTYATEEEKQTTEEKSQQARLAVAAIGTNAFPILLERLRAKDSRFSQIVMPPLLKTCQKIGLRIRYREESTAKFRRGQALTALLQLEVFNDIGPILADLRALANDPDADIRSAAQFALTNYVTKVLPPQQFLH